MKNSSDNFFDMEMDMETNPLNNFSKEENILNGNSNGNDIPDCAKYNKAPEFNLDFLTKTIKKRFVTGSSLGNEGLTNDIEESDSEDSKGKKYKKSNKTNKNNEEGKWGKKNIDGKNAENSEDEEEVKHIQKNDDVQPNLIKEFCNEEYGIFEKGLYVRIDIKKIKRKFANNFKPDFPMILCTTNLQENSFGFLKIKFTKHLWYPKILKNNDPIILSIGWRKFQVTPIFCIEEKQEVGQSTKDDHE